MAVIEKEVIKVRDFVRDDSVRAIGVIESNKGYIIRVTNEKGILLKDRIVFRKDNALELLDHLAQQMFDARWTEVNL
jgi:hypothetical protein